MRLVRKAHEWQGRNWQPTATFCSLFGTSQFQSEILSPKLGARGENIGGAHVRLGPQAVMR
jgi:hypothetical protein